jgi:hypothetical protein
VTSSFPSLEACGSIRGITSRWNLPDSIRGNPASQDIAVICGVSSVDTARLCQESSTRHEIRAVVSGLPNNDGQHTPPLGPRFFQGVPDVEANSGVFSFLQNSVHSERSRREKFFPAPEKPRLESLHQPPLISP